MGVVMLSNPGLDLAIYGNPSGTRKKRGKSMATRKRRRRRRRNPARRTKAWYRKIGRKGGKAAARKRRRGRNPARRSRAWYKKIGRKGGLAAARKRRRRRNPAVGRTYRVRSRRGSPARTVRIVSSRSKSRGKYRRRKYARQTFRSSGRKGTRRYTAQVYGGRRGRGSRRVHFTNPNGAQGLMRSYFDGLISSPQKVIRDLRGRNMLRNALWLTGGTLGTFVAGGAFQRFAQPWLARVPMVGPWLVTGPGARFTAALWPYTFGFIASRFIRERQLKNAVLTGGAVASILSILAPNFIPNTLARMGMSGLGAYTALANYDMLAGYVEAPGYQGTAGYVEAPGYQGTAGYVEAPSYAGAGDVQLAGVDGYLDQNYLEYGYLSKYG